ncbi:MAG: diguanylate cyclase [Gammaproteobacteria bacterium]|nr:diguanylate cyclase [Gammaproteobacteria bacterium]
MAEDDSQKIATSFLTGSNQASIIFILLLFGLSLATIISLLVLVSFKMDNLAQKDLYNRVEIALSVETRHLQDLIQEYSYWDEGHQNLIVQPDYKWADENIGSYLTDNYGVDFSGAILKNGSPTIGFINGVKAPLPISLWMENGLGQIITEARNNLSGRWISSHYLDIEGAIYLVSVGLFRDESSEMPKGDDSFLLIAQLLDDAFIQQLSDTYQLNSLHKLEAGAKRVDADMYLLNPMEKPIVALAWTKPTPGEHYLRQIFLPIISVFIVMATLTWSMLVHERKRQDKYIKHLYLLASKDYLTGISNRREFFSIANREMARAKRAGTTLSLIIFDIDYFKQINDKLGHHNGDAVLSELARRISENLRDFDVFARIGGEEFVVLLPETGCHTAMEIAERLRQLIHDSDFFSFDNHETIKCTISSGVAVWKNQESIDALLNRADDALYAAKRLGRNRTQSAEIYCPTEYAVTPACGG